ARELEMHAVQTRVGHDRDSGPSNNHHLLEYYPAPPHRQLERAVSKQILPPAARWRWRWRGEILQDREERFRFYPIHQKMQQLFSRISALGGALSLVAGGVESCLYRRWQHARNRRRLYCSPRIQSTILVKLFRRFAPPVPSA